ncbi:hypothetical protein ACSNOI_44715 [Actinomadura kijaniata]|uniref:hypothetical protein n=1 Tax=Actinomadura kijaniata TaxID=46161 RepID=UPI003F1C3988
MPQLRALAPPSVQYVLTALAVPSTANPFASDAAGRAGASVGQSPPALLEGPSR